MVVAHLLAIDEAATQGALSGPLRKLPGVAPFDGPDDAGQLGCYISVDMTTFCAWVAEELVALVEFLRDIQGALCGVAKTLVRLALELGEVVELWGRNFAFSGFAVCDGGSARFGPVSDGSRSLSVWGEALVVISFVLRDSPGCLGAWEFVRSVFRD